MVFFPQRSLQLICSELSFVKSEKKKSSALHRTVPMMFETLVEKPVRSASGRKCPIDGVSPVAVQTPLPTTPSTFRPRKGPKTHNIGDDALPPQLLKIFDRASPSKSPAAETPRELKDQTLPPPPPPPAGLDQFDRQLQESSRLQRPAGARQSQQDSPSAQRSDSFTKVVEANRSTIAENIKRLLEDYAKKFTSPSSPSPTCAAAQSLPSEDPLARIVKLYSGPQGASPFPAPAGGHGATPSGPVDKEVSGLVGPITKRYQDPALQAIPKPKADTTVPITEELLRDAQKGARPSTKKLLRSDKSNFSETSSKKVGPPSAAMSPSSKRVDS
jgi:hypothetical protein